MTGGGHPHYADLMAEQLRLHMAKNHDYADTERSGDPWLNFRGLEDIGVDTKFGVLVRMSDKWQRLKHLAFNAGRHAVDGETIRDTLMDLAGYANIFILMLDDDSGKWSAPQAPEDVIYAASGEAPPHLRVVENLDVTDSPEAE